MAKESAQAIAIIPRLCPASQVLLSTLQRGIPGLNTGRPVESALCVHGTMINGRLSDAQRCHRDRIIARRGQV